ncbi:MAG: hypothetical protein ACI9IP_001117 [Arcticibacterium sp.]
MKRFYLGLVCLLFSISSFSQNFYVLRGYVYSNDNFPLPGANIRDFDSKIGTQTNAKGQYELNLEQGLHRISVSYIGYDSETFEQVISGDNVKNIFLTPDTAMLAEVVVSNKKKDFSYEIIKNIIDHKEAVLNQYQNYACQTYIKSLEEPENIKPPKKEEKYDPFKNDSIPKTNYFEADISRYVSIPNKTKEERTAVKKIGDLQTLFFTSTTDGEFNLYENVQHVKQLSENAFVSPISPLGFASYRYKLLDSYYDGGTLVYKIAVKPKQTGNALYEGEIEVWDKEWVLKSVDLKLSKRALIVYDEFSFKQAYEKMEENWVITEESFTWKVTEEGQIKTGTTTVSQSNFVFDSTYSKNFFGPELAKTTALAYKRDSTFWDNIRPKPLSIEERNIIRKEEAYQLKINSKDYLDSIDAVYNKITFMKVAWEGVGHINRKKKTNWEFGSIPSFINLVAIGGWRAQYNVNYYKKFENRKQLRVFPYLNYGFLNKDLRGQIGVDYLYNPVKQSSIFLSAGQGFDVINGNATILDIVRRDNFYINTGINAKHRTEIFNGFYLNTEVLFNKREDLGDFKFSRLGDELFDNNSPSTFPNSSILKTNFRLDYTPKQLYISEPNEKIVMGSKYPTFSFRLSKAFQLDNNLKKAFTNIEFNVEQYFNVGILGTSEYRIGIGRFLDTMKVATMDYQYQRGGDPIWFSPSMYTYQYIPETFSTFKWFFESHYEHQFNGFLTSKIPLLNKTDIKTVAGAGLLYVPDQNYQYSELYAGVNRVFKLGKSRFRIGAYYVAAQSNKFGLKSGFKFSFEPYNRNKNTWSF